MGESPYIELAGIVFALCTIRLCALSAVSVRRVMGARAVEPDARRASSRLPRPH